MVPAEATGIKGRMRRSDGTSLRVRGVTLFDTMAAPAATASSWASGRRLPPKAELGAGYDYVIGTAEESVLRMPGTQPVTFSGSMPSCLQIARAVFFLISLCRGTVLF